MKRNILPATLFVAITLSVFLLSAAHNTKITKPLAIEGNTDKVEQITADKLNGKPTFFKTFEDFANGTGKSWEMVNWDIGPSFGGKLSKCVIIFKDENKNKVKVSTEDFWGWRSDNGEVYRNGDFVSGNVTKYPFRIQMVAKDYIQYIPASMSTNLQVSPDVWYSADMKSPILTSNIFFKSHSKIVYDRISKGYLEAGRARPVYNKEKKEWEKAEDIFAHKSDDIICFWHSPKGIKGTYIK